MADTLEQMLLVGMKDLSSRTLRCKLYSINILRVIYIYIYIHITLIFQKLKYIYIYHVNISKGKEFFQRFIAKLLLELSLIDSPHLRRIFISRRDKNERADRKFERAKSVAVKSRVVGGAAAKPISTNRRRVTDSLRLS